MRAADLQPACARLGAVNGRGGLGADGLDAVADLALWPSAGLLPLPASGARGEGWGEGHKRDGRQGQERLSGVSASSPGPSPLKEEREIRVVGWWQCLSAGCGQWQGASKLKR